MNKSLTYTTIKIVMFMMACSFSPLTFSARTVHITNATIDLPLTGELIDVTRLAQAQCHDLSSCFLDPKPAWLQKVGDKKRTSTFFDGTGLMRFRFKCIGANCPDVPAESTEERSVELSLNKTARVSCAGSVTSEGVSLSTTVAQLLAWVLKSSTVNKNHSE